MAGVAGSFGGLAARRVDQLLAASKGLPPPPPTTQFPFITIVGPNAFLRVYFPAKAPGDLIAAIAAQGGNDGLTNVFAQGIGSYGHAGGKTTGAVLNGGALLLYSDVGLGTVAGFIGQDAVQVPGLTQLTLDAAQAWSIRSAPGNGIEYYFPSGDTSGATDLAAINSLLQVCNDVRLLAYGGTGIGRYFINGSIVVPTGAAFRGGFPVQADINQSYGNGPLAANVGSVIVCNPGAGQPAIKISNTTTTPQGAQVLDGLTLEGNGTPLGSGSIGILLHGLVGAGFIDNCVVHRFDGPNLKVENDSGTGFVPDQWRINRSVFSASRSDRGVQIQDLPDSTITDCLSHANALANWDIANSTNSKMVYCRGEDGAGLGLNLRGFGTAGQTFEIIGYGSELNQLDGILFDDGPTHAGSALGTYILTGCRSNNDNQSGAAAGAAYRSAGCKSRIMVSGSYGAGAKFGANETAASYGMAFSGCYLAGSTAATNDDGSNTHVLSNLAAVPF